MRLAEAQKLRHVRRDYSSWSMDELREEYDRIGQEILRRVQPPGSRYNEIERAVDKFFRLDGIRR